MYSSKRTSNVHTYNEILRILEKIGLRVFQAESAVAAAAAMVACFARRPPMFQRFAICGGTKTNEINFGL